MLGKSDTDLDESAQWLVRKGLCFSKFGLRELLKEIGTSPPIPSAKKKGPVLAFAKEKGCRKRLL